MKHKADIISIPTKALLEDGSFKPIEDCTADELLTAEKIARHYAWRCGVERDQDARTNFRRVARAFHRLRKLLKEGYRFKDGDLVAPGLEPTAPADNVVYLFGQKPVK